MTPEARVLAALDSFRDALAEYLADHQDVPKEPAALVTVADAARALGIARSTCSRWAASGHLPSVTVDGRRWVRRSDLDRLAAR